MPVVKQGLLTIHVSDETKQLIDKIPTLSDEKLLDVTERECKSPRATVIFAIKEELFKRNMKWQFPKLRNRRKKMNGYVCFYNSQRWECNAYTLIEAKEKAIAHFKPPKSKRHMVSAVLAEKDGKPVEHKPLM